MLPLLLALLSFPTAEAETSLRVGVAGRVDDFQARIPVGPLVGVHLGGRAVALDFTVPVFLGPNGVAITGQGFVSASVLRVFSLGAGLSGIAVERVRLPDDERMSRTAFGPATRLAGVIESPGLPDLEVALTAALHRSRWALDSDQAWRTSWGPVAMLQVGALL